MNRLWRQQILLARHPGVSFDLSALPAYCGGEEYPYASACRYIQEAVKLVGADKLLWGTDIPGLLIHATYRQLLDYVAQHCDFLTQTDRSKILGENAWRLYGNAGGL